MITDKQIKDIEEYIRQLECKTEEIKLDPILLQRYTLKFKEIRARLQENEVINRKRALEGLQGKIVLRLEYESINTFIKELAKMEWELNQYNQRDNKANIVIYKEKEKKNGILNFIKELFGKKSEVELKIETQENTITPVFKNRRKDFLTETKLENAKDKIDFLMEQKYMVPSDVISKLAVEYEDRERKKLCNMLIEQDLTSLELTEEEVQRLENKKIPVNIISSYQRNYKEIENLIHIKAEIDKDKIISAIFELFEKEYQSLIIKQYSYTKTTNIREIEKKREEEYFIGDKKLYVFRNIYY